MKKCVFAGTFDPFTLGHADTVEKALALFDEVVVAVAENKQKRSMFSLEERLEMVQLVYQEEARVKVIAWEGVIIDLLKKEDTPFYVRGVRNSVDFVYETDNHYASRDLSKELITLYFPAERELMHVSSSLVKNCITFKKPFEGYVPAAVYSYIRSKYNV